MLALFGLHTSFNQIQVVEIPDLLVRKLLSRLWLLTHVVLLLPLHLLIVAVQFHEKLRTLLKDIVSLERIDRIPILIDILVLLHFLSNSLTQLGPLVLVLLVALLQGLILLLHLLLLLTCHSQIFLKNLALLFFLVDVLI